MLDWLGQGKRCLAVAGTHGKTTTSSMLASALTGLNADPSFLIGGVLKAFAATAHRGQGPDYVIEADESDGSFTYLHPQLAIITNIERDHLDHYESLAQIKAAFQAFIQTIPDDGYLVYCADDAELPGLVPTAACKCVAYGFSATADYQLEHLPAHTYSLRYPDGTTQPLTLAAAPGRHNALNAAAVLVSLDLLKYPPAAAATALQSFAGTARRFELIGRVADIDVVDDYGHHPTEIRATLAAARGLGYKRIHAIFQPHRYTRTHELFADFLQAFDDVDSLTLLPIYAAGETPLPGVDAASLATALRAAQPDLQIDYQSDRARVVQRLSQKASAGDLIITIGAGDVTHLAPLLVAALEQRWPSIDANAVDNTSTTETGDAKGDANFTCEPLLGEPAVPLKLPDPARPTVSGFEAYCELEGSIQGTLLFNEPMARHTSYHIGGPAALYVECISVTDLNRSLRVISDYNLPWAIVGKGTNLLVSDQGFEGAILTLGSQFKEYSFPSEPNSEDLDESQRDSDLADPEPLRSTTVVSEHIVAGAGVLLSDLVQRAFKLGYAGLEFAVGIPGTLGGAVFMNAGGSEHWMSEVVTAVTVLKPGVGLARYKAAELPWHYRSSGLPLGEIILEAELQVRRGDTNHIRGRMEGLLKRRRQTQPLQQPNAGSIFKNPEGASAGKMIDELGFKGYRVGDACVSELHANFIVNCGNASASDVVAIIQEIRRRVRENYGQELQTEIRFLGFS